MVQKRKREASSQPKGLAPGKILKHDKPYPLTSPWDWVGSEVTDANRITDEHRLATCNLSRRNKIPYCINKFASDLQDKSSTPIQGSTANGELENDIIVISDDEEASCRKKLCKANPNCLNYLGQERWLNGDAKDDFIENAKLGRDPTLSSRDCNLPVGLKNLGATCYANASLQVWYRDLAFRQGVYLCKPPENISEEKYKESPIFQLQVTFASLQAGNTRVFNPNRLVESLQLRAFEQQDAQEFSKLFMSHLDSEFKKQTLPSVKSLVTDQFQGSLVYGTLCHACKNRSERSSDFLEIEITLDSNSKLENRIANTLLPETLSGENKYFCSNCNSLQIATRSVELQKLPPVLHFSLMRFVYDVSTMERKKSKHSISFPTILDMGRFLHMQEGSTAMKTQDNLYELRGVLLHKGSSAYHGHYEAQVKDGEMGSWFLFNDETVTELKSFGSKPNPEAVITIDDGEEMPNTSQVKKSRVNARKRKLIEDSDDDDSETKRKRKQSTPSTSDDRPSTISSKDAYMLIYAKVEPLINDATKRPTLIPQPPSKALEFVHEINALHERSCQEYYERKVELEVEFETTRQRVQQIFRIWNASPFEDTFIASRQAIEQWLTTSCLDNSTTRPPNGNSRETQPTILSIEDVICEHRLLDPMKISDMKRLSQLGKELIQNDTNCIFDPLLTPNDVCVQCTKTLFHEKLYEYQHPRIAKRFDEISGTLDDEIGYWISRKWCRDWRLLKPRMHQGGKDDPAPDSPEFYGHVYCEHGCLSLNPATRRKISREASLLLKELFPLWDPPSTDAEPCAICDAMVHISKQDKRETRRQIEDEKALFKFLLESTLDTWKDLSKPVPCAAIPTQFIKHWRRWVNNPAENSKPEGIDNEVFLCEHRQLLFDPNDLDSTVTIILSDEWNLLKTIYTGGPLLPLSKRFLDAGHVKYDHNTPICAECRLRRKTEWETTDITVILSRSKGPTDIKSKKPSVTHQRNNGARQSKRLRQIKEHGEKRRLTVCKNTTVRDIKVMVHQEFSIPTICQRLFHNGVELDDNSATVEALQILANDRLDLREMEEIINVDSDSDAPVTKKRKEGPAFVGTLLGNESSWTSSPEQTPAPNEFADNERACHKCTFRNPLHVTNCEMCETPFE